MAIYRACEFPNPMDSDRIWRQAEGPPPRQGNHVFGDVIGMVETALEQVIGGDRGFSDRFLHFNQETFNLWERFRRLDLGHTAAGPVVNETGPSGGDEHSDQFGRCSHDFQRAFCEVVCTGYSAGLEVRIVGLTSVDSAWHNAVIRCYHEVVRHLVDQTALMTYLQTSGRGRPIPRDHPAISLDAAKSIARESGNERARERIREFCDRFWEAEHCLSLMLEQIRHPARQLNQVGRWDLIEELTNPEYGA